MTANYQPNHDALAKEILLSQYRKGKRIMALVGALADGVQAFEDEAFDTLIGTPLSVAKSGTLDQWGRILGESRGTLDDPGFREILNTKLLTLRSTGSVPDILRIWLRLNDDADDARYEPSYPAAYSLYVTTAVPYSAETIARVIRLMESVRPAGVGGEYIETPTGGFRFNDATRGFDQAPMGRSLK